MPVEVEIRRVPVRQVGDVRVGKQLSPAGREAAGQFPYLRVANVHLGSIDYTDVKTMGFSSKERQTYALKPGDILLNEGQSLELVGRSAIYDRAEGEFFYQNTLVRFRPGGKVIPQYAQLIFERWLVSGVFAGIAKQTTSIAHLGGERFGSLSFPILSLADQRRIVDVVGAVLRQERALAASIAKLNALGVGIIAGLADLDCGAFEQILDYGPQNGIYKPGSAYGFEGTPIVRIDSFRGGPSDFTQNLLRVSLSSVETRRFGLDVGDILINRVNAPELVGKTTSVSELVEPVVFESNMMRCKVRADLAVPEFVEMWLGGEKAKAHFRKRAKSAISQASINGDDIRSCPFPRLGIQEQRQFLGRLVVVRDRQLAEKRELIKLAKVKQGVMDDMLGGPFSA